MNKFEKIGLGCLIVFVFLSIVSKSETVQEEIVKIFMGKPRNHIIHTPIEDSRLIDDFLKKHDAPKSQVDFLNKFYTLPVITRELEGTRRAEEIQNVYKEFEKKLIYVDGWICKVYGSSSLIEPSANSLFDVSCSIDGDLNNNHAISFNSENKYYKDDIIKITSRVDMRAFPANMFVITTKPSLHNPTTIELIHQSEK